MDLQLNTAEPLIMHIDLNSAFAMIEQQANPLIRHKPVAVAAYETPGGMILTSSYEAKAMGIKIGLSVAQARAIDPGVIILTPDSDKYFDAHHRFKEVLLHYTDAITPKSVDEFVMDFHGSDAIRRGLTMEQIGQQIKQDMKDAIGEYTTVNVGIGPSRFLAKMAAGLHKPDGLDIITHENLREIYAGLELIDLTGINIHYRARLHAAGIYTPLQFLDTPAPVLVKQVFHGIVGYQWYMRLRGHEIDDRPLRTHSFGQQYALGHKTYDRQELARLLMKLCEKTGRRLRRHSYAAYGVHLYLKFDDHRRWSHGQKQASDLYSTQDIFTAAKGLLDSAPIRANVTLMQVTVYNLRPQPLDQQSLFDNTRLDRRGLALASDEVNDRYGEFTIVPALMANMENTILKRVPFGSTRDMEL